MMRLFVMDIDGALTDRTVVTDSIRTEHKRYCYRDVDAIYEMWRAGWRLALVTGESTSIVSHFRSRFPHHHFIEGCKDKCVGLKEIIEAERLEVCESFFIGDGRSDVESIGFAGLRFCPADACRKALLCADILLERPAGRGAIAETFAPLLDLNTTLGRVIKAK